MSAPSPSKLSTILSFLHPRSLFNMDSMILVKIPVLWIGTYLISSALAKIYLVFAHPGYTPSEHRWLEAKEDGNIPSDTAYEQFRQKERTHGSYYWTKRDDQELLN